MHASGDAIAKEQRANLLTLAMHIVFQWTGRWEGDAWMSIIVVYQLGRDEWVSGELYRIACTYLLWG